jgi:transcription elongation GreA/GreB family factor
MSRAFVKDDDDRPERPIARSASENPNYVTAKGLARLRELLTSARAAGDERDVTYLERRIADAIVVDVAAQPRDRVAFGATVTARESDGRQTRVRIVGEDEAEPAKGTISWISPFAQALQEGRVGDVVVVQRPAGATRVEILTIDYEE